MIPNRLVLVGCSYYKMVDIGGPDKLFGQSYNPAVFVIPAVVVVFLFGKLDRPSINLMLFKMKDFKFFNFRVCWV